MQMGEFLLYDHAVEIAGRFFNFGWMLVGCMKLAQPDENLNIFSTNKSSTSQGLEAASCYFC